MQNTNFDKVLEFNYNFGMIDSDKVVKKENVFNNPNEIKNCMNLIREEMRELEDAVSQNDSLETLDALTDILYVVYGMGARLGYDMDKAFELVHANNMSKLCFNEQEAIESVQYYRNNPQLGYESPNYRLSADNKYYVVYNESTRKILKCNSKAREWKPVDLSDLI